MRSRVGFAGFGPSFGRLDRRDSADSSLGLCSDRPGRPANLNGHDGNTEIENRGGSETANARLETRPGPDASETGCRRIAAAQPGGRGAKSATGFGTRAGGRGAGPRLSLILPTTQTTVITARTRRTRGRAPRGAATGVRGRSRRTSARDPPRRCRPAGRPAGARQAPAGRRRRWPCRASRTLASVTSGCGPASAVSTNSRMFSGAYSASPPTPIQSEADWLVSSTLPSSP